MDISFKPRDQKLFDLVTTAVEEGLRELQNLEKKQEYILSRFQWIEMESLENGIPYFSEQRSGPPDYSQAFGWNEDATIRADRIESFNALKTYVCSHSRFLEYHHPESYEGPENEWIDFARSWLGYNMAMELVDMFRMSYQKEPFSKELFAPLYNLLEGGIFDEPLIVELVIPILCLKFDLDEFELAGGILIRRMDTPFQLARARHLKNRETVHSVVAGAATRAIVLQFYKLSNKHYRATLQTAGEELNYKLDKIDLVFSALRIANEVVTGYAQILQN